jgi:hypothetical protein
MLTEKVMEAFSGDGDNSWFHNKENFHGSWI